MRPGWGALEALEEPGVRCSLEEGERKEGVRGASRLRGRQGGKALDLGRVSGVRVGPMDWYCLQVTHGDVEAAGLRMPAVGGT